MYTRIISTSNVQYSSAFKNGEDNQYSFERYTGSLAPINPAVIYPEKPKNTGSRLETEEYHTNYYIIQEKTDHLTIHGPCTILVLLCSSQGTGCHITEYNKKCTSAQ